MKYNKCNRLAASTWASGRITSFMEKGSSFLKMAHIMREPFTKANLKEKEDIFSIYKSKYIVSLHFRSLLLPPWDQFYSSFQSNGFIGIAFNL